MAIIATTTKPVYRHQQDTGRDCGRACAQMIISSLSQAGSSASTIIAVEQEELRQLETNRIDIEHWWFTEPDEFCGLLKTATDLNATDRDWRVASHSTVDKLLADLILSMQAYGRPAAVTTGAIEHWMVLIAVHKDAADKFVFLLFNPLPSSIASNVLLGAPPFQHKFMDACGTDQQPLLVVNHGSDIADLNLKIAGFTKPKKAKVVSPAAEVQQGVKLPPPSAVASHSGKAVGVVFGASTPTETLTLLAATLKSSRLNPARLMVSNPVDAVQSALPARFRSLTESFQIKAVQQVLMAPDLAITAIRQVTDLKQPNLKYVLCSGYSHNARHGFVAAFDGSAQADLLHVQITNDMTLIKSLAAFPGEPLFWTTEQTTHFPPMAMPYFVFRAKPGQPGTLVRLYDNAEGEVVIAEPGHRGI
jgi:hypothetical protein